MDKKLWSGFAILLVVAGGGLWMAPRVDALWNLVEPPPTRPALPPPSVQPEGLAKISTLWDQTGDRKALLRDYGQLAELVVALARLHGMPDVEALADSVRVQYSNAFIDEQIGQWLGEGARHLSLPRMLELAEQPALLTVMRRLNETPLTEPSTAAPALSPQRRALVEAMLEATGFLSRHTLWTNNMRNFLGHAQDVFDPTQRTNQGTRLAIVPPREFIIDHWAAAALEGVPDADLQALLEFAKTGSGGDLMRLATGFRTYYFTGRMEQALVALREAADLKWLPKPAAVLQTQLAEARAILLESTGSEQVRKAHQLLLEVLQAQPDNSEAHSLLAYALLRIHPESGAGDEMLRKEDLAPDTFKEIESILQRALELDADNLRALVMLARVRFLQSRDDEVEALQAHAELINSEYAWLRLNRADLATEQGRYDQAIDIYRGVLHSPEPEVLVHLAALRRSWVASTRGEQPELWDELAKHYLSLNPESQYARFRLARHILSRGGRAEDAARVMEPVPDPGGPDSEHARMMALIGIFRALELRDETGRHTKATKDLLRRSLSLTSVPPLWLLEQACQSRKSVQPLLPLLETQMIPVGAADAMLTCALANREAQHIGWLVERGADVNGRMTNGVFLPLEYSLLTRDAASFEALLLAGAETDRLDVRERPLTVLIDESAAIDPVYRHIHTRLRVPES
jgi:tetratricopeptide (TPR) repeat protein